MFHTFRRATNTWRTDAANVTRWLLDKHSDIIQLVRAIFLTSPFPIFDRFTRHLNLVTHVAHHYACNLSVAQEVDDSSIIFLLPVGEGLHLGINFSGRLVAELEQVREKIRLTGKWFMCAGHILPRPFSLVYGVVSVLHAHRLSQWLVRKKSLSPAA